MYWPDLHKLIEWLTRVFDWFDGVWVFVKRNWPIVVAIATILALSAVLAGTTATLQSCGCQGPTLTPTSTATPRPTIAPPTVTPEPSPTPTMQSPISPLPTPTPQPIPPVLTDQVGLYWQAYGVEPIKFTYDWDDDGYLVVDVDGNTYETTCTGEPEYDAYLDMELRQDGVTVASHVVLLASPGIIGEPGTGQWNDDIAVSWDWSADIAGLTGEVELWERTRWQMACADLPVFVVYVETDDGLMSQDADGYSLMAVYDAGGDKQ